jgi:arylsulfatase A-like enzyme
MAIRVGDYKLVRYDQNADTRTGRDQPPTPPRLYHLSDDISESHDLASEQPERLRELQSKWDAWSATLAKPLWGASTTDSDGPEPSAPHKKSAKAKP